MSAPERIADVEKQTARLVTEPSDGAAGHAAGEIEMAEGALDAAIHRHGALGRDGIGHAGDPLPASSYTFAVIDGRRILGGDAEIVAPLDLVEANAAADERRDVRFVLEIIEPV